MSGEGASLEGTLSRADLVLTFPTQSIPIALQGGQQRALSTQNSGLSPGETVLRVTVGGVRGRLVRVFPVLSRVGPSCLK